MRNSANLWQQLYQHATHPHYLQSSTWHKPATQLEILTLDSQGEPLAGSLLSRIPVMGNRFAYYEAIRGPLFVNSAALALHLQQLKTSLPSDAIGVQVSPYIYLSDPQFEATASIMAEQRFSPVDSARNNLYTSTPVVTLAEGIDNIRANYRNSFKRQINKGKKDGIEVSTGHTIAELATYIEGHSQANLARGAPLPSESIIFGWHQLLKQAPEQFRLTLARYQGQPIAGQISVVCGDRMIYEWGFSNSADQFKNLAKSHMLHDSAIQHAISKGLSSYDLGGFWKQQGARNSLNRFKLTITGNIEETFPKHEYVIRPAIHQIYQRLRNLVKRYRT